MRKADSRPQFKANNKLVQRSRKIAALAAANNPDARKERKQMNVHAYGKLTNTNVKGMYGKQHPCKAKVNGKNRPCLSAMKAIMSRRAG